MTSKDLRAFSRQPSTIHGIAALVGTAAGAIAFFVLHATGAESATISGTVFGLVSTFMRDNTGSASSVEKLVLDAATAAAEHRLNLMIPTITTDIRDVLVTSLTQPVVPVVQVPPGAGAGPTGNAAALVVPTTDVAAPDRTVERHHINIPSATSALAMPCSVPAPANIENT